MIAFEQSIETGFSRNFSQTSFQSRSYFWIPLLLQKYRRGYRLTRIRIIKLNRDFSTKENFKERIRGWSALQKEPPHGNEGVKADKWIFFIIIALGAAGEARSARRSTCGVWRAQQFASQIRVEAATRPMLHVRGERGFHPYQTMSQSTSRGRFLTVMWLPIVVHHNHH